MKQKRNFSKILDNLVIVSLLPPQLFFAFCFVFSLINPEKYKVLMGIYDTPYLPVIAVLTCIVLALWILIGNGASSKLWGWLPPFVFFRKIDISARPFLVFLLIAGTLVGLLGDLFGLVDPKF